MSEKKNDNVTEMKTKPQAEPETADEKIERLEKIVAKLTQELSDRVQIINKLKDMIISKEEQLYDARVAASRTKHQS